MTSPFWYCAGYPDQRQLRPGQRRVNADRDRALGSTPVPDPRILSRAGAADHAVTPQAPDSSTTSPISPSTAHGPHPANRVLLAAEPGDDLNLDGNASRQLGHTDRCTGMAPGITEHLDQQIRAPI